MDPNNLNLDKLIADIEGVSKELAGVEEPKAKLLSFISLKSARMDSGYEAIATHINNLIATYGEESVRAVVLTALGLL